MSRVIKAGDETHGLIITPLDRSAAAPASTVAKPSAQEDPLVTELHRLRALVVQQQAEIDGHGDALEVVRSEAETAGRQAMELEFEENRERALELLAAGINMAHASLGELMERAELLGMLVTRTVISKLFGQDGSREAIVIDLAKHQLAQINRQSLVAIEVSRHDFPDTREVEQLATQLGMNQIAVSVSDELASGDCRMRCQLGTIDIGLDQQWGTIREMLDSWVQEPADAE